MRLARIGGGVIAGLVAIVLGVRARVPMPTSADLTAKYAWQPVRIGAGGWVVGFVAHPKNPNVCVARTDVGNAYRWEAATGQWAPLKVVNQDGSGFPATSFTAPGSGGVQSVALDPSDDKAIFLAVPNNRSADIGPSSGIDIYRSFDSGKTFKAGNLSVPGDPNDNWRYQGERLCADPNNGKVIYYGTGFGPGSTTASGLYRSVNRGATWTAVDGADAFAKTDNIVNVLIDKASGLSAGTPLGTPAGKVSARVWARGGHMVGGQFWSDLYSSQDGGATWVNISKGTGLGGKVGRLFLDPIGALYVIESGTKTLWKFRGGHWTTLPVDAGDNLIGLAIDPKNSGRMFAIGGDASTTRTTDGGKTWTNFGRLQYANRLGWLPQAPGNAAAWGYRSTGGIDFDAAGNLWVCQGNEGMLRYAPSSTNAESTSHPPKWTIESQGIEELVAQDILVPKGSGDKIYTAVEDATGMVVPNPDDFSAVQIPLQTDLISQGSQVAGCPGDPNTVAISTSSVYNMGKNYSGISLDAGKSWAPFGSCLRFTDSSGTHDVQAGSMAISRRGGWSAGSDHLVQLPVNNLVPIYSKDGGKTWAATTSFPTEPNGMTFKNNSGYQGFWIFALKQRMLYADPFVPDKFYLKLVNAPAGLYVTTDGGATWSPMTDNGLPQFTHHGQLAVNANVRNDLWFVDGWEGSPRHGLFHSTNGGSSFAQVPSITNAITLALGAGSGAPGAAAYTVYLYGKFATDPKWGVFRSTDGGATWDRVAYYPTGIFDQPTCMAASWDTFGRVYVGFSGNSYVYGKLKAGRG